MATENHKEKLTGIQTMRLCSPAQIFFVIKTYLSCTSTSRSLKYIKYLYSRALSNNTFYIKIHYK